MTLVNICSNGNLNFTHFIVAFPFTILQYPVHSILVFDQHKNAIPVAWIITPNFAHGEIYKWMGALYDRAHTKDPTWQLGGFVIDDPLTDVSTIR